MGRVGVPSLGALQGSSMHEMKCLMHCTRELCRVASSKKL